MNICFKKGRNYLRIAGDCLPGAPLLQRAMRGHRDVGTLGHVNFEPGDAVPSRADMTRLIERMEDQHLIVGVLHWVLDNESWLQHATLRLTLDALGGQVEVHTLTWHGKVWRRQFESARHAIPQLYDLLRHRRHCSNPRYVRLGVIEAMNAVDWSPERVIDALGIFAAPALPETGREWIERHHHAYQLHRLQADTPQAVAAAKPTRL